jgi:hypothetical protein
MNHTQEADIFSEIKYKCKTFCRRKVLVLVSIVCEVLYTIK